MFAVDLTFDVILSVKMLITGVKCVDLGQTQLKDTL